jgi:hypothetical protein
MVQQDTGLPILARFPDMNENLSGHQHHTDKRPGLLGPNGRLIGQATSIKLLAGTALFLVVGAILPLCIGKSLPANRTPVDNSLMATQSKSGKAASEVTLAADGSTASATSRPAIQVAASKELSPAPAPVPRSAEADEKNQARLASGATAKSSPWPNVTAGELQSANAGNPASQPGTNQSGPVCQAGYEADTRAASTPDNNRGTRR